MNRFALGAALAALSLAVPGAADAQRNRNNDNAVPAILVVDTEKLLEECNACRAAATQLEQQAQQFQQMAQQLGAPLQQERQAIQTALNALNGRAPDAAMTARMNAFQTRENNANQTLQARQQVLRSTQAHISQQLENAVTPIVEQVRNQHNALVVVSKNATLARSGAIDVTAEVMTALNAALPSLSVTPLPQQPQQQPAAQPPGR